MRRSRVICGATLSTTERCWSGRTGLPAKQLHGQNPCRGFESPPLRSFVFCRIQPLRDFSGQYRTSRFRITGGMPLNLYRRHQGQCEANRPLDSRSGEFEERRKGWKKCGCFIFASGTLRGKFKRKYTGRTEWNEAEAVANEWEKAGSWDGEITVPIPVPETPLAPRAALTAP